MTNKATTFIWAGVIMFLGLIIFNFFPDSLFKQAILTVCELLWLPTLILGLLLLINKKYQNRKKKD